MNNTKNLFDFATKELSQDAFLRWFFENYENILTYFANMKKNKAKTFELLLKQKDCVFVSHIPVASTLLRPQSITSDTFYFTSIDKIINTTFSLSENLKNCIDVEKDYILQRLQTKVNKMWNIYFEELYPIFSFVVTICSIPACSLPR